MLDIIPAVTSLPYRLLFSKMENSLGAQVVGIDGIDKGSISSLPWFSEGQQHLRTHRIWTYMHHLIHLPKTSEYGRFYGWVFYRGRLRTIPWNRTGQHSAAMIFYWMFAQKFEHGHIEGAINIPLDELNTPELDQQQNDLCVFARWGCGATWHSACAPAEDLKMYSNIAGGFYLWEYFAKGNGHGWTRFLHNALDKNMARLNGILGHEIYILFTAIIGNKTPLNRQPALAHTVNSRRWYCNFAHQF